MTAMTRREFVQKSAGSAIGAALVTAAARETSAGPLGLPIGSQTWPHRQRIKDGDFAGLCKDMAALGIGDLELCSPAYAEFGSFADAKATKKILEDHGLRTSSAHVTMPELRTKRDAIFAWARDLGMTQVGTATLSGPVKDGSTTMDAVKAAADEYNAIAEAAAKAGLQQFLHDEGFEMSKVEGGRLTYEVLLERLDPKLVKMQFQMSAMRVVGDPVTYFTKHPGRFLSMHLQGVDLKAPLPTPGGPRTPQVAVGKDSLDWPKIFAAAKTGGVKNYYLEQSWDLTVEGATYLKTLKL